jgi:hypothetical protein
MGVVALKGRMSNDEAGLDLIGAGKLAKAIPAIVWKRMAETACSTFEKALAPLTETTSGLGRFLAAKFDKFTELEKINAALAFQQARAKIEISAKSPVADIKPKVLAHALSGAGEETDEGMRELWSNLIAREFTTGEVHPLIPQILSQMTSTDARRLSDIHSGAGARAQFGRKRKFPLKKDVSTPTSVLTETESEATLMALGLIRRESAIHWVLTALGEAFIEVVQEPKQGLK